VAHRRLRLGIPVCFARRQPWTPEEEALLGTAPDTAIAARLGRHLATVCIRRQKLGIPNACRKLWSPEEDKLLGTKPDEELARTLESHCRFGQSAPACTPHSCLPGICHGMSGQDASRKMSERRGRCIGTPGGVPAVRIGARSAENTFDH